MRERLLERWGRLFQRRELILRHLRHLRVDAGGFGDDLLERRLLVTAFLDGGVRADDAFGARELFIDARDFGGARRGIGDERGDERVVARGDGLQTSLQRGGHDRRTSGWGGAPVRPPARRRAGRGGALAAERSRRRMRRRRMRRRRMRRRVEAVGWADATGETRRRPRPRPRPRPRRADVQRPSRRSVVTRAMPPARRRAKDCRIARARDGPRRRPERASERHRAVTVAKPNRAEPRSRHPSR